MQEAFLHYVWKHQKFSTLSLQATDQKAICIKHPGLHNMDSGPDFFNAQIAIDDQLWAGNVEIHLKSSDWYAHYHETNPAYDNVILHVVWEHDTEVFRNSNEIIPTLVLKPFVANTVLLNYNNLIETSRTWINCEHSFGSIDDFIMENWLERLYVERLEQKATIIEKLLEQSQNDWEAVLFKMIAKNFGAKVNSDAFLSIAQSFDYSIVRKLQHDALQLEALFFGQAGLLDDNVEGGYYKTLQKLYRYNKHKFSLHQKGTIPVKFFRLRPNNFPTIRLSQLAALYKMHNQLFSKCIEATCINDFYKIFKVSVSEFWTSHYTFSTVSKTSKKELTDSFIDLLVINTIIPLQFCYAKHQGRTIDNQIFDLLKQIRLERNTVVSKFLDLKVLPNHALTSQALLQLKHEYCNYNKCLQCAVGHSIVGKK
ncbi:MAG: DUF2851 family protein [Bacteroidota bacterium]